MEDEDGPSQPIPKVARRDPEESPKQVYAPYYAGSVNQASFPVDDEAWEKEVEEYFEADEEHLLPGGFDEEDEGCPPELDEEELMKVEEEAGQEEIQRLLEMGVLREPTSEEEWKKARSSRPGQCMIGGFGTRSGSGGVAL